MVNSYNEDKSQETVPLFEEYLSLRYIEIFSYLCLTIIKSDVRKTTRFDVQFISWFNYKV